MLVLYMALRHVDARVAIADDGLHVEVRDAGRISCCDGAGSRSGITQHQVAAATCRSA